jgi:predicted amidohydrolase
MMDQVRVAVAQVANVAWLDPRANVDQLVADIERIASGGPVDLIVFPELIVQGYITGRDPEFGRRYARLAEPVPGPTTVALGKAAKRAGAYVVFGMARTHARIPGVLFNSAVLLDREGNVAFVHDKAHIPGEENHFFAAGHRIQSVACDFGRLGISICYEGRFPEVARLFALQGSDVYVNIWARSGPPGAPPESMTSFAPMRASENRFYVVSCNRVGTENGSTYQGLSAIADPLGKVLGQLDGEPGVLRETLVGDRLLWARAQSPVFSDRRPDLYGDLTKMLD